MSDIIVTETAINIEVTESNIQAIVTPSPTNITVNESSIFLEATQSPVNLSVTQSAINLNVVENPIALKIGQGQRGEQGPAGKGVPVGGTAGQILEKIDGTDYNTQWADPNAAAEWGNITGTLSNQTDLQAALDAKVDSVNGATGVVVLDTDDIAEGATNKYDQTVVLNEGTNVTITGTYPSFTINASGGGSSVTHDTRENIFAIASPTNGDLAYATDYKQLYYYDDGWQEADTIFTERAGAVDAGVVQDSSPTGYGRDYISSKHIANCKIGSNRNTDEGGIRRVFSSSLQRNLFQIYLSGGWQTILTGVNIQTDDEENPVDIEFTDFAPWVLSLITGNSDLLSLNGFPTVQNMKTDAGAYQTPLVIDGGSF